MAAARRRQPGRGSKRRPALSLLRPAQWGELPIRRGSCKLQLHAILRLLLTSWRRFRSCWTACARLPTQAPALARLEGAIEAGRHDALLITDPGAVNGTATHLMGLLFRCTRNGVVVGF